MHLFLAFANASPTGTINIIVCHKCVSHLEKKNGVPFCMCHLVFLLLVHAHIAFKRNFYTLMHQYYKAIQVHFVAVSVEGKNSSVTI